MHIFRGVDEDESRQPKLETGSYLTAHTTIQSLQTTRFRRDAK